MAVTNQLNRIASLVERLDGLGGKQRGMRIEAEQWNALVEVVAGALQISRAQEETAQSRLEERFARSGHQHLGEVTAEWLDPDLRTRLGADGSAVSTRNVVADLEQRVSGLAAEVARLTARVEEQQAALDRFAADEIDRGRTVRGFEDRFVVVEELRGVVGTLSNRIGGVTRNVEELIALRRSLTDEAGAPIDVLGLRREVKELGTLRENLRGVDGRLLRLRDVELRLTELGDAVGLSGPGGLEGRFAGLSVDLQETLSSQMDERVTTLRDELLDVTAVSETRLRTELTSGVDAARASIGQQSAAGISAAEVRLRGELTVQIGVSGEALRLQASQEARGLVDQRLADLPERIRTGVDSAVTELRTGLRTELLSDVAGEVKAQVGEAETRLALRVEGAELRVTEVEKEMPRLVEIEVAESTEALTLRVDQRIEESTERLRLELSQTVRTDVKTAVDGLALDSRVQTTVESQLGDVDLRVERAVAEATLSQPDLVATEVRTQLGALQLAKQIEESSATLSRQLRTEVSQALSEQQARTSTAISGTVTLLRGEMSAAVKAGTEEAVRISRTELNAARTDVNAIRPIDPALRNRPLRPGG